ncbi:MAG: cytochrome C [Rhodoferax sp.]|uniref:cytochrome C n=1 Tax=Rhodoferax sp. TaxID=50421 RepID=UPI00301ABCD4
MKKKLTLCLAVLVCSAVEAEDVRQLAPLPAAAAESLRDQMRANLLTLNEIISLTVSGKLAEAGVLAEQELGNTAMGKNRKLPFEARPGPHMPPAMHAIAMDGHKAASAFALIAATGDREKTLDSLPTLTTSCVSCHFAYRIR